MRIPQDGPQTSGNDDFSTDGTHIESDFDTADSGPRVEPAAEKPKRKPYKKPRIKREKSKNKTPYLGIRIAIQLRRGIRNRAPMEVLGVPGGLNRFRLVYGIVLVRSLIEQYYAKMAPDKHDPRNHNKLLAFIRSSRLPEKNVPDAATLDTMIAYVDQLDLSWYAKMPLGRAIGDVIGLRNEDRIANKMDNIWPAGWTKTRLRNEHNERAARELRRKRLGLRPGEEDKLTSLCLRPNERLEHDEIPGEDVDGNAIIHPLVAVTSDGAKTRLRIIRRRKVADISALDALRAEAAQKRIEKRRKHRQAQNLARKAKPGKLKAPECLKAITTLCPMVATDAFTIMNDIFGFKKRWTNEAKAELGLVTKKIGFPGVPVWISPSEDALFQRMHKSDGTNHVDTQQCQLKSANVLHDVPNHEVSDAQKAGHGKEGLAGPATPIETPRGFTLPCKTPVPSAAVVGETPVNGNSKHFNNTVKVTQATENIGENVGIPGKKGVAMLEYDEKTGRWSRVWN
jgi:hypothetical protein